MDVCIFEEHSSVLPEWWRRGMRARTVIYLDAHLDLQYVNAERLAALERCRTATELERLEKPHHLLPGNEFVYSIEDFLYAAHRLGLIDRLIWVAPPHVETGYSEQASEQLQQMDGVVLDELESFERKGGGWLEGRLLGLNITICNYHQLAAMALPPDSLIDIDTDYFVAVPGDEVSVNPREVFEVLRGLAVTPELVTLSRSVSSGFLPLRYRFLADYLAALWEQRDDSAAHYDRLFELDFEQCRGAGEGVVEACEAELGSHPGCAATHYLMSLICSDSHRASQHRRRAEELCDGYRPSVLRAICEFPNRQLRLDRATVESLEKRLAEGSESRSERALAQVGLGLIYCAAGQVGPANRHYRESARELGQHPELALEIAKLLLRSNDLERAIELLKVALDDDKTRAAASFFLGQVYAAQGSLEPARHHLQMALDTTPLWADVRRLLTEVCRRLGKHEQAQALLEQGRRQASTMALFRRALRQGQ